MAPISRKINFIRIMRSIVSLFNVDCYNYTWYIGKHFHDCRAAALEVYKTGLTFATRDGFNSWLLLELNKFFKDFEQYFTTGDENIDKTRRKIHQEISRKSRNKKWRKELAVHIYVGLYKHDWPNFVFPEGRDVVVKLLKEFIFKAYCIDHNELEQ